MAALAASLARELRGRPKLRRAVVDGIEGIETEATTPLTYPTLPLIRVRDEKGTERVALDATVEAEEAEEELALEKYAEIEAGKVDSSGTTNHPRVESDKPAS